MMSTTAHTEPSESGSRSQEIVEKNSFNLYNYYSLLTQKEDLRAEHNRFCQESISPGTVLLTNLFLTFSVYPQLIVAVDIEDITPNEQLKIAVSTFAALSFLVNWILAMTILLPSRFPAEYQSSKLSMLFRTVSIYLITVTLALHFLRRGMMNSTSSSDFLLLLQLNYENPYQNLSLFPMDSMLLLALVPMALLLVLRISDLRVITTVFSTIVFSLLFLVLYEYDSTSENTRYTIPVLISYVLFGGLIFFDACQHQYARSFLHQEELQHRLAQQSAVEEMRRQEMRHMIANVAHDLKSPLSSFLHAIELIQEDVKHIQESLFDRNPSRRANKKAKKMTRKSLLDLPSEQKEKEEENAVVAKAREGVESIHSTVQYIQNINNFMVMTINRCLDCTKASSGLKLTPKFETVHLVETLRLPIGCMSSNQQRIAVELLPWDTQRISQYLITDKQWLQENVLCLLSNAVKYSVEGTVTIAMDVRPKSSFLRVASSSSSLSEEEEEGTGLRRANLEGGSRSPEKEHLSSNPASVNGEGDEEEGVMFRSRQPSHLPREKKKKKRNQRQRKSWLCWPKHKVVPSTMMVTSSSNAVEISLLSSMRSLAFLSLRESLPVRPAAAVAAGDRRRREGSSASASVVSAHSSQQSLFQTMTPRTTAAAPGSQTEQQAHEQDYLVVEIEDTGIGLSPTAREQLFSPFKQTQRLAGGTGLGLYSLAKRLEALKGFYGVEGRRDGREGSRFWFAIPYQPDFQMEKEEEEVVEEEEEDDDAEETASTRNNIAEDRHPSPSIAAATSSSFQRPRPILIATSSSSFSRTDDEYHPVSITTTPTITSPAADYHRSKGSRGGRGGGTRRNKTSALLNEQVSVDDDPDAPTPTASAGLFHSLHLSDTTSPTPTATTTTPAVATNATAFQDSSYQQKKNKKIKSHEPTKQVEPVRRRRYQILLADDTPTVSKMMTRLLERHGHVVTAVENGARAVKAIQQSYSDSTAPRYDLLLMDLQMPVMDGIEATKRIRSFERELQKNNPTTTTSTSSSFHQKIVCVSGNAEEETKEEAFTAGMDAFVSKPFTYETFEAAVAGLFENTTNNTNDKEEVEEDVGMEDRE